MGTRPRVLSDLLGHRDPESLSAYVRIATETLREVSLPVPTMNTKVTAASLAHDAAEFLAFKRAMGMGYRRAEFVLNGFVRFVRTSTGRTRRRRSTRP